MKNDSLTKRELELAKEYEALGDDPERRDAIRRELYNIRWKLDRDASRKYHSTGKGRGNTTMKCRKNWAAPGRRQNTSTTLTEKIF